MRSHSSQLRQMSLSNIVTRIDRTIVFLRCRQTHVSVNENLEPDAQDQQIFQGGTIYSVSRNQLTTAPYLGRCAKGERFELLPTTAPPRIFHFSKSNQIT